MILLFSYYAVNASLRCVCILNIQRTRVELFCQLFSDTAVTDRRLRYRLSPKANIALKILRSQLVKNLALQFKGKALTEKQSQWQELAIRVLGRWKSPDGNVQQIL